MFKELNCLTPRINASDCDYIHPLAERLFGASDDRSLL